MRVMLEVVAAMMIVAAVLAGLAVGAVALWVRARRRRARARLERVLDGLATEVALRLAEGRAPGWALTRYRRLTDETATTRTWGGLQRLIWRERILDGVSEAGRVLQDPAARARAMRWVGGTPARLRSRRVPVVRR